MGSCNTSTRSHFADLLAFLDCVAFSYERTAEMKVTSDDPRAVIDVDDLAGQKEIIDERHDTAIRGAYRRSDRAREIHSKMSAREGAVEHPPRTESTGYGRRAWIYETAFPHRRCRMSTAAYLSRTFVLPIDSRLGLGIERSCESRVHGKSPPAGRSGRPRARRKLDV